MSWTLNPGTILSCQAVAVLPETSRFRAVSIVFYSRIMADTHSLRFSRRAMREYGTLLLLIGVSALAAMSLFAISAPGIPRRRPAAEPEAAEQRKFSSSRRSLGDHQLTPLATAGDDTLGSGGPDPVRPSTPPAKAQHEEVEDAAPTAMSPLYSSVESYARFPLSAAKEEAGKGCATCSCMLPPCICWH